MDLTMSSPVVWQILRRMERGGLTSSEGDPFCWVQLSAHNASLSSSQAHCLPRQIREGHRAVEGGSAMCGEEEEQFSGIVGELHQRNCSSPFFLPIRSISPHIFRRMERSYSTFKVRRGSREKIPLIQGKEQQLALLEQL